jgi:hypothetical protein
MTHRKREYEANGHEVTIQQVNEGGDISAWIDGYAAYINSAMDSLVNDSETANLQVAKKAKYNRENGETWKAIEATLAYMTDCHVYYCNKCNRFYDYNNVVGTGFAGHKCLKCKKKDDHCPDNPDGNSHEDTCLNPRQKHNARVATKYKCKHCGRKRSTTPTG